MSAERKSLNVNDPYWGEHVHRYLEILPYVNSGDRVLDIACGTGYGTHMLAGKSSNMVTGGDISEEAVQTCAANWKASNLEFKQMDGTRLPFEDNSFDKIVSFETIEHTTEYLKMLAEFKRVLKPTGTLFLSTPNQEITSPDGIVHNPYHTQEFSFDQFREMLGMFSEFRIKGQKFTRFSKKGLKNWFDRMLINFLQLRGIRKIPFGLRTGITKLFTGQALYPTDRHFTLVDDENEIRKLCPVLFAICKK